MNPMRRPMKYLKNILLLSLIFIVACSQDQNSSPTIKVGTISGPETTLMEVAKEVAQDRYDLAIEIVEFNDYAIPHTALNDGSIDAKAAVTRSYFDATLATKGYDLTEIGLTFIYPMGIYSNKINELSEVEDKAVVTLPNDPSNEERALLLLQQAGLITVDESKQDNVSLADVVDNPKNLRLRALEPAQLPRTLADADLAVINTNYAVPAGLNPQEDALFAEDKNSPYVNIIAVRTEDKDKEIFQQLVESYQSQAVIEAAQQLFGNNAIAAWK